MTSIYRNTALARRMNISCVVVVGAILYGLWELWAAYRAGPNAGYGYLFGVFFVGGGIYGMKQIRDESFNMVVALDADVATGASVVSIWRPFAAKRIAGRLDGLTDWRFHISSGRVPVPMLLADHPGHPRPLQFELRKGAVSEALRSLAPEAVAAYERAPHV